MADIVEVDDNGKIALPDKFLSGMKAHARLEVEMEGNTLRVKPAGEGHVVVDIERLQVEAKRLWTEATPEERVRAFREWLEMPRHKAPPLPDEALHRESMYD